MDVDFGRFATDYGRHRAGFSPRFLDRLAALSVGGAGQRLLDLGTGTGDLARKLALRGARVTGLDPSEEMLRAAATLDGGDAVRWVVGRAEATGLESASFDAVTAAQCWHWFDRPRAAAEVRRLLVPGGRVAIGHLDWIALAPNVVAATEELIARHNPAWSTSGLRFVDGLHGAWLADLARAGFAELETFSFDVAIPYTHEGWRGRMRASAGVGASLSPDEVARFDSDLAALLDRDFPGPQEVPHRCFAAVAVAP